MNDVSHPPRPLVDRLPMIAALLAVLSLAILAASGIGARAGAWHFRTGFTILKAACFLGGVSALIALVAIAIAAKRASRAGVFVGVFAFALSAVACGTPVTWMLKAKRVPRIHDISTDLAAPPPFVATAQARGDRSGFAPPEVAAQQRQAYPELKPLILPLPQEEAFRKALETARKMGWEIVANVPAEGRIEATDTTVWFGFKDDVVVRVKPQGARSVVDVRSASRVGISDVGTNAARIRFYLSKLEEAAGKGGR